MEDAGELNDGGGVVSIEEYLSMTLAEVDHALGAAAEVRDLLALRLRALRMADDERVANAVGDYERRVAEGRGYEDAVPVEDLLAEADSRR